ncbi:MAG: DNA polymerase III subunit alpha, partial [Kiritimatiellae bacterium]|nr:DNA polymerase III subunit alpha [Kiritimatiellia bacterium]
IGRSIAATIHEEKHVIRLLAKNKTGYHNLVRISSAEVQPQGAKDRFIAFSDIEKWREGLICMTSDTEPDFVNECLRVFGEEFAFMADNDDFDCSAWPSVMVCAANPVRFIEKDDVEAYDVYCAIFDHRKLADGGRRHCNGDEYLMSREEMSVRFPKHPEWIENTVRLAERIEDYEICEAPQVVEFPIPHDFGSEAEYLSSLVYEGMKKRWGDPTPPEIVERIDFELHVIKMMGFPSYFLIVHDYVEAARRMGVWVGPARGSATGSAVAYALGITSIDPIKHRLLFERFLNPDRISMPDIDIDFEDAGRGKVVEYLCDKYGRDHVAHIVTFGQMAPRSAIKDVARVLEYPIRKANALAGLVPEAPRMTFRRACSCSAQFRKVYENGEDMQKKILRIAEKLEGCVRQPGTHACGIVISRKPLSQTLPLMPTGVNDRVVGGPELITQYDGQHVESVGLIKFDILGLKALALQKDCMKLIRARKGEVVDLDKIPCDEPETMEVFARGDTENVFQFESDGMKRWLMALKPRCLDDLVAMNALYRPGPIAYTPTFVRRKNGEEPVAYDHPLMEDELRETYGVTIYQEQIMILSRKLAGFTRGESDKLRKAMGKKMIDIMEGMKVKFVEGCLANQEFRIGKWKDEGEARRLIDKIWGDWRTFASYAFNKSHAVAYAWLAYQSAYLKAHYPNEFMLALMESEYGNSTKISGFIEEARSKGILLHSSIDSDKMDWYCLDSPVGLTVLKIDADDEHKWSDVLNCSTDYSRRSNKAVLYYSLRKPRNVIASEGTMNGAHLVFNDTSAMDVDELCANAHVIGRKLYRAKATKGMRLGLIVVDYLQLVNIARHESEGRAEQEDAILDRLVQLAYDEICQVVVLSQKPRGDRVMV